VTSRTQSRLRRIDAQTNIITTVAGDGTAADTGDGGPAADAQLNEPNPVEVDAAGNIFVGDRNAHRVRRIDAVTGIIDTVIGTGTPGTSGDGGPADEAEIAGPVNLAISPTGDVFVVDQWSSLRVAYRIAASVLGDGYWFVAADGGVFTFGDAAFYGSTGGVPLNQPIVGMAATTDADGYWLVARDGGIFSFGDARFYGSTGGVRLNQPIVGMTPTPTGNGYWMVASDGGIFSFGDAKFHGSTGGIPLNRRVVGMAATPSGNGYWLVAADGGLFSFGTTGYYGSLPGAGVCPSEQTVAMAPSGTGKGYWITTASGAVFAMGDAPFLGSASTYGVNAIGFAMARA
jgi:hypothetical protein